MSMPAAIRVIAIALVRRGDELLVFEGFDAAKGSHYYRPLGGGVEPGERAADALARELREELNAGVANVRHIGVLENVFECDGRAGHEVVFVFEAELTDRSIYARDAIDATEDSGAPMRVVWRSLGSFDEHHRLVPEGLMGLARAGAPVERASRVFSATIAMWLELDDGRTVDVAQSGSDFLILRGDDVGVSTPLNATFASSVDGRVTRDRLHFPAGITGGRDEHAYIDVGGAPEADDYAD